jgi:hypothetical protein
LLTGVYPARVKMLSKMQSLPDVVTVNPDLTVLYIVIAVNERIFAGHEG